MHAPRNAAGTVTGDEESGPHHEYEVWLEELVPRAPPSHWRPGADACSEPGDRNAGAHLKRRVKGREVGVAVTNGHVTCGTWEQAAVSTCRRRSLRFAVQTFTGRWR